MCVYIYCIYIDRHIYIYIYIYRGISGMFYYLFIYYFTSELDCLKYMLIFHYTFLFSKLWHLCQIMLLSGIISASTEPTLLGTDLLRTLLSKADNPCIVSSVFPGDWTHDLCAANATLYHWAKGTQRILFSTNIRFFYKTLISMVDCHGEKITKHGSHDDKNTLYFGGLGQITDTITRFWSMN